jgi:hypothetical protein
LKLLATAGVEDPHRPINRGEQLVESLLDRSQDIRLDSID